MWLECPRLRRLRFHKESEMGFFGDLFGGGKNPADEANKYLNQIPGTVSPYYQPYINQGMGANKDIMEQFQQLINNPNAMYDKLAGGYKESPGYQTRLQDAMTAVRNANAAGGMAGSPQHEGLAAERALDLRSKDFEDYLGHVFGLYGTGLQGEQGIGQQGFEASKGLADILGSNLGAQGQYAYAGQAGKNANFSNLLSNLFKGAGMLGLGGLNLWKPEMGQAFSGGIKTMGGFK
jgi:hypothetical protein